MVQHRAMVHQVRPAQPAVLAQRLPGLVQGQVRELVVPDGRVGHVPAVRIHIGSFLHCGGECFFFTVRSMFRSTSRLMSLTAAPRA